MGNAGQELKSLNEYEQLVVTSNNQKGLDDF
jgi:hypothetical protein